MTYKEFSLEYSGRACRSCINIAARAHLVRKNCIYVEYPAKCTVCGEVKNIVQDVTLGGRWKMFWKIQ